MPQSEVVTILFTDLVGSTEHLQREGDEASDQLFRVHHRSLSNAIESSGGTELEWLGTGYIDDGKSLKRSAKFWGRYY